MSNLPYDLSKLWEVCNNGLDYFHEIYPESVGKENKNKHFKTHNEKTASSTLSNKGTDGVYIVYNHATKEHYNAIDHVKITHNLTFIEACEYLFDKYGLQKSQNTIYKAEKTWNDNHDKPADYWKITPHKKTQGFEFFAPFLTETTCKEYDFVSLEAFESVKTIEKTQKTSLLSVKSTPEYPIFAYNPLKTFAKIYEPKASKNSETGFSTKHHFLGKKPERFIYGWDRLFAKVGSKTIELIEDALKNLQKSKTKRDIETYKEELEEYQLPAVFIATGGSDGLNLASLGYDVIWFNSEAEIINSNEYHQLKKIANKIYYVPDLDTTGRNQAFKMGMQHLDIEMVWLPEELQTIDKKKDLADWVKKHKTLDLQIVKSMFAKIVTQAKPFKFWTFNRDRGVYTIDNRLLFNFLHFHGFFIHQKKIKNIGNSYIEETPIYLKNNIIQKIGKPKKIRNYVLTWLEKNYISPEVYNVISKSTFFSENNAWNSLKEVEISTKHVFPDKQIYYFENKVIEINKEQVKEFDWKNSPYTIWEDQIIKHKITLSNSKPFEISKDENGNYTIEIFNKNSNYFKVLINSSRMFWMKDDNNGFDQNPFEIASNNLTESEKIYQQRQLINKIYIVGYLLHQYKTMTNPLIPVGIDYKIGASVRENNGGSGKSFILESLKNILQNVGGSNAKSLGTEDDKFIFDGVTEHTRLFIFSDLKENQKFRDFFNFADSSITVNNKGKERFELPFDDAPKFAMTTNFVPSDDEIDGSFNRRFIFYQCSDYYHQKSNETDFTRKISDDFGGREILKKNYPANELNEDFNFWFYCLNFYLNTKESIDAPKENFVIRSIRQKIGDHLLNFFAEYFDEKDELGNYLNLNTWILRKDMLDEYNENNGKYAKTSNAVKDALQSYCKIKGWELKIQKKAHYNSGTGKRNAVEHFYINSTNETIPQIPTQPEETNDITEPETPF